MLQMATALAVSFAICKAATSLSKIFGIQGGELPTVTAIVVILATLLPSQFRHLAPAGDAFSLVLMQVNFFLKVFMMKEYYVSSVSRQLYSFPKNRYFLLFLVLVGACGT